MDDKIFGTYLGHSGYLIELPNETLVFDWCGFNLPPIKNICPLPEIRKNVPLCFFVSHIHSDHFNQEIFRILENRQDAILFIGYDRSIPEVNAAFSREPENVRKRMIFFDGEEKRVVENLGITVTTLSSTDLGVAFIVEVEGKIFFHAGDLYLMRDMSGYSLYDEDEFEEFTDPIRGKVFDFGMIPLDSRSMAVAEKTAERYMSIAHFKSWSPIHLWDNLKFIDEFLNLHPEYKERIIANTAQPGVMKKIVIGQKFELFSAGSTTSANKSETPKAVSNSLNKGNSGAVSTNARSGNTKGVSINSRKENAEFLMAKGVTQRDYSYGPINVGDNKEFWILAIIHNEGPDKSDVARNVRVSLSMRNDGSCSVIVNGKIHCDNAAVKDVFDNIRFVSDKPFKLKFYNGSAFEYTQYYGMTGDKGIQVSDDIMTPEGALVGYVIPDGTIPGGMNNAVSVSIKVRVEQ